MMKYSMRLLGIIMIMAVFLAAGCDPDSNGGPVTCTVRFAPGNGTSIEPIQVSEGEGMGDQYPPDPVRGEDQFTGWYSGGTKYERDTPITTDITLAARWNLGPRGLILREIEDNWQSLGYDSKPTKYIALSFDDGPSAAVTRNLLNALAAKNVKATFFLIGQNIRSNPALAAQIFAAGHEIGNHSDGYGSLGGTTAEAAIRSSLTVAQAAINDITGEDAVLFRAPNVNYGNNLTNVCRDMNLAIIGVSVWSSDWEGIDTPTIITNVVNNSFLNNGDGGIINCHELANTVAAIPEMIDGLREKGFWIMTVGELAVVKEIELIAGTQYDSIR